jgi:hypothetical protein
MLQEHVGAFRPEATTPAAAQDTEAQFARIGISGRHPEAPPADGLGPEVAGPVAQAPDLVSPRPQPARPLRLGLVPQTRAAGRVPHDLRVAVEFDKEVQMRRAGWAQMQLGSGEVLQGHAGQFRAIRSPGERPGRSHLLRIKRTLSGMSGHAV